jgi:hypothetical protein
MSRDARLLTPGGCRQNSRNSDSGHRFLMTHLSRRVDMIRSPLISSYMNVHSACPSIRRATSEERGRDEDGRTDKQTEWTSSCNEMRGLRPFQPDVQKAAPNDPMRNEVAFEKVTNSWCLHPFSSRVLARRRHTVTQNLPKMGIIWDSIS